MKRILLTSIALFLSVSLIACTPIADPEIKEASEKNIEEIEELNDELKKLKKELEALEVEKEEKDLKESKDLKEDEEEIIENIAPHSEDEQGAVAGYKKHAGRFYDVEYPENFTILSEETAEYPETTSWPGTDAVTVISPDKKVEFYVFSPLCRGEAKWKSLLPGESAGSETSESGEKASVNRGSINGPGYARFYEENIDHAGSEDCVRVFGLKYTNAADYEAYKEGYSHFKKTLTQYWWD